MAGSTAARSLVLRRPLPEKRLDDAFGKRLTLVIAEAGYGKSTLVAGWTEGVVTGLNDIDVRGAIVGNVYGLAAKDDGALRRIDPVLWRCAFGA